MGQPGNRCAGCVSCSSRPLWVGGSGVGKVVGERGVNGAGHASGPQVPPSARVGPADQTSSVFVYVVFVMQPCEDADEPDR